MNLETTPREAQAGHPFCSQPWSTLYVQWDGALTRPCIRGPQNLGSLEGVQDIEEFWNGETFQAVRSQVRDANNLNSACSGCLKDRTRTIDHLTPYLDNVESFNVDKIDNYYLTLGEYEKGKPAVANKPVALVLDLSSRCQIRCPKCFVYNSNMQHNLGHMSLETFAKVEPFLRTALQVVGHENGESMLNPNFMKMVRTIKEHGCRFTFNTTGQLLLPEKSRQLVDLGVDQIMFSIDSIDPERYKIMHRGGTLERLMRNLEGLRDAKTGAQSEKPLLGWYFVACKSNIAELPAIIDRAGELGFATMYLSHLNAPTKEQWRSYFDYYRQENLLRDPVERARFKTALDEAQLHTAERKIRLYSIAV